MARLGSGIAHTRDVPGGVPRAHGAPAFGRGAHRCRQLSLDLVWTAGLRFGKRRQDHPGVECGDGGMPQDYLRRWPAGRCVRRPMVRSHHLLEARNQWRLRSMIGRNVRFEVSCLAATPGTCSGPSPAARMAASGSGTRERASLSAKPKVTRKRLRRWQRRRIAAWRYPPAAMPPCASGT